MIIDGMNDALSYVSIDLADWISGLTVFLDSSSSSSPPFHLLAIHRLQARV